MRLYTVRGHYPGKSIKRIPVKLALSRKHGKVKTLTPREIVSLLVERKHHGLS
jgi:hypothetical protein